MSHREWMFQATRDLEVADHLRSSGYYEWAAYAAQQAAEKAVKALRTAQGVTIDGTMKSHEITNLLRPIADLAPSKDPRLAQASQLTVHNQDARYPSMRGVDGGFSAPGRTYDDDTAQQAIEIARAVIGYAEPLMNDLAGFWAKRVATVFDGRGATTGDGSSTPNSPF